VAESTTSGSTSGSTTPSTTTPVTPKEAPPTQQVILQSARDSELQPDALRGNPEIVKKLVDEGTLLDLEADRADAIKQDKK
jgi:hypothetical protein